MGYETGEGGFFFILYIITLIEFLGVPLKSLSRRWRGGGVGLIIFSKIESTISWNP